MPSRFKSDTPTWFCPPHISQKPYAWSWLGTQLITIVLRDDLFETPCINALTSSVAVSKRPKSTFLDNKITTKALSISSHSKNNNNNHLHSTHNNEVYQDNIRRGSSSGRPSSLPTAAELPEHPYLRRPRDHRPTGPRVGLNSRKPDPASEQRLHFRVYSVPRRRGQRVRRQRDRGRGGGGEPDERIQLGVSGHEDCGGRVLAGELAHYPTNICSVGYLGMYDGMKRNAYTA